MQYHIPFRAGLVVVTFLAAGLTACADAISPWEEPAQASKSANAGFEPLDIKFSDPDLCAAYGAFPVWTQLSGNLKVASVQPRQGGGLRIVEIVTNGQVLLSTSGKTLRSPLSGTVFYELDADENLQAVTYVGLNGVFTVPGSGRIALETGRLVIDANGAIVFESGPHDVFGSNPDVAKLCAYLAP
jgi:hypothetical protein